MYFSKETQAHILKFVKWEKTLERKTSLTDLRNHYEKSTQDSVYNKLLLTYTRTPTSLSLAILNKPWL